MPFSQGVYLFPAETEQRVPGWLQRSLVKVHLLERIYEQDVGGASIVDEDVVYSEPNYIRCCYKGVYVWKILHLKVIFVKSNGHHGPSRPVERYPWRDGVHSSFKFSSSSLVFVLLSSDCEYMALQW